MNKLFEKIARLSPALRLGALIGSVVVIFAVFYFGVIGGTSSKADETREIANLERAKKERAEVQRAKAEEKQECEQLQSKLKKSKRKMRRFRGMLPDDPQIWLLMKEIKDRLGQLSLKKLSPAEEERKKIYSVIPLDLVVEGTFHQLLKFLHDVSKMPRIVNVQDVDFERLVPSGTSARREVRLRAKFRITTFRYRQRHRRRSSSVKKKKS